MGYTLLIYFNTANPVMASYFRRMKHFAPVSPSCSKREISWISSPLGGSTILLVSNSWEKLSTFLSIFWPITHYQRRKINETINDGITTDGITNDSKTSAGSWQQSDKLSDWTAACQPECRSRYEIMICSWRLLTE